MTIGGSGEERKDGRGFLLDFEVILYWRAQRV